MDLRKLTLPNYWQLVLKCLFRPTFNMLAHRVQVCSRTLVNRLPTPLYDVNSSLPCLCSSKVTAGELVAQAVNQEVEAAESPQVRGQAGEGEGFRKKAEPRRESTKQQRNKNLLHFGSRTADYTAKSSIPITEGKDSEFRFSNIHER